MRFSSVSVVTVADASVASSGASAAVGCKPLISDLENSSDGTRTVADTTLGVPSCGDRVIVLSQILMDTHLLSVEVSFWLLVVLGD